MTEREFINRIAGGEVDVIRNLLNALQAAGADYCVIGGLAVNAYAEPVVSLDLDVVVVADCIEQVCAALTRDFTMERFAHSVNFRSDKSDLRVQLQTDARYQDFVRNASARKVLGYEMKVASVEDVLRGKVWAYSDKERRRSKRQKDLADILRLVEAYPALKEKLPPALRKEIE
jgi:hypothetical protein